jgi:hypothetical protein
LLDFVNAYLEERNAKIELNLGYYSYSPFEPMKFWGKKERLSEILNKYREPL